MRTWSTEEYLRHGKSRQLSAQAVLRVIGRHAQGKRLLDVGCATGDFLACAKQSGYDGEGLEISRWSSSIARQRGLAVHEERLETFSQSREGRYDVVTLWGVIEHFVRPSDEMRSLFRLLKPGGLLALWTGDVDSLTACLLGRKWWYWQGQHIQYFSHKSLKLLAESHGLQHVATELYPFTATRETFSNSLRRYPILGPVLMRILSPLFFLKPEWYIRVPGEMFFLVRQPLLTGSDGG